MTTYMIVRFFQDRDTPSEVISRGHTLEEVQEHCSSEETHGEGWFDGYEVEAWPTVTNGNRRGR